MSLITISVIGVTYKDNINSNTYTTSETVWYFLYIKKHMGAFIMNNRFESTIDYVLKPSVKELYVKDPSDYYHITCDIYDALTLLVDIDGIKNALKNVVEFEIDNMKARHVGGITWKVTQDGYTYVDESDISLAYEIANRNLPNAIAFYSTEPIDTQHENILGGTGIMKANKVPYGAITEVKEVKRYGGITEVKDENPYLLKVLDLEAGIKEEQAHKALVDKLKGLYDYCVVQPHVDYRYALIIEDMYADLSDKIANPDQVKLALKKIEEIVCI